MVSVTEAHEHRRADFLRTAQDLFFASGYADTPVSAIIDRMGVAKGTFYHYFKSKEDLLDQMVDALSRDAMLVVEAEMNIDGPSAVEQLSRVFQKVTSWKADHKSALMVILHAIYREENLLLRRKLFRRSTQMMTPFLSKIICRGIDTGEMTTRYPTETAELISEMGIFINAKVARIILSSPNLADSYEMVLHWLTVYERKVEKLMGAKHESLCMFNRHDLREILS